MREWNAEAYHRVSSPQFGWGQTVLARLPLEGDELVLDVGCGTGRLTELLAERLPRGRAVGVDLSDNMLRLAAGELGPRFGTRIGFVRADATALPFASIADAVFSTATFHWVLDHRALFRSVHATLRDGGVFVAQCGGVDNIARLHHRADELMRETPFAPHFERWSEPWEFANAETTAARLADAGFVDIATSIEAAPVVLEDAPAYFAFVTSVICRPHLAYLPDDALRVEFVQRLTDRAAADPVPFELDYWRLNIAARKAARRRPT